MFAVVSIAGKQFKVTEGQELYVHRLDAKEGDEVTFEDVLLTSQDGDVAVGAPQLDVNVSATVLEHLKDDKVIVFKKKRRKGYRRKNGHRQQLTRLKIDKIA
ncbi:50S ribosomal protein L21 [Membranihabitans maritimus]|uniref:50S ribosomal protein L21 n=1 Tax=Membranihabitans maritimus TaxID=2904244 RepID=UPI001F028EFA|nr:50S ribosomal protein L21 [Membranihabitans maritimus]